MKTQVIHVITTGGTIDKSYDETDGSLANRESIIRNSVLADMRLPFTKLVFHPLFSKDSLHMDDADRQAIADCISDLVKHSEPIIVIHGTDTMAESATTVYESIVDLPVPVIFTGAMAPAGFQTSDAFQNLAESFMAGRLAPPGVYICFHNVLHRIPGVKKDRNARTFVAADQND